MNDSRRPTRSELDLQRFSEITLGNLMNCYVNLKPGAQSDDFIQRILNVVGTKDDPSIETPHEIILQFISDEDKAKGPEWVASSPIGSVIVSCAYCLRAMRAMKAGDLNLGWSYMADARYWSGVAISSKGIAEAYENTRKQAATEADKSRGQAGAKGRDKLYAPVREYVYQRVRAREQKWSSLNQAAQRIAKPALEFMAENCPTIKKIPTQESFEVTLKKWLGEMPDAQLLFETLSEESKRGRTAGQSNKKTKT